MGILGTTSFFLGATLVGTAWAFLMLVTLLSFLVATDEVVAMEERFVVSGKVFLVGGAISLPGTLGILLSGFSALLTRHQLLPIAFFNIGVDVSVIPFAALELFSFICDILSPTFAADDL